jgi:hypothetical protein
MQADTEEVAADKMRTWLAANQDSAIEYFGPEFCAEYGTHL